MEKDKVISEDITQEIIASGVADTDGNLVSADAVLKSSAKDRNADAKAMGKAAMYAAAAKKGDRKPREEGPAPEFGSKLICVNRITKVVKGGRTLRFNAVVIVGNKNGKVAVGSGKAREVTEAIKKAEADAKKVLKNVPIVGTTIPHEVIGRFGTSRVKMIPTKEGNGLIAGGSVRAVLELAGYKDVTAKCYGSTNSTNVVKATMNGIMQMRTRDEIAALRGKKPDQI
jgi:small subunit ribosomal protein S5